MADGVWCGNNPRLAMSAGQFGNDAQTMVFLSKKDRWFISGRDTTRTSVELRIAHAKEYKEYAAKRKCHVDGCNNKGIETVHQGETKGVAANIFQK